MSENQNESLCYDGDGEFEYDCGDPNFTGEADKLPPHIREVQEQLAKDAFGDNR